MVDIRFEADSAPVRENFRNSNSKLTQLFIDKSFGLVQTPKQAVIAQVIVAITMFILAGYLFASSAKPAPPAAPSQELIDSPQPTRPLLQ